MSNFLEFVQDLNERLGLQLPKQWARNDEVQVARTFLTKLNEYFYQTYKGIGTTTFDEEELQYFSEFHKFWEAHHKEVLIATVDQAKATSAATLLHLAAQKYGKDIFKLTYDTHGLAKQAIAQVRFFTANQDFRTPPDDQYQKYTDNPETFNAQEVHEDPVQLLKALGMTGQSQTDKRTDFAKNAAKFLIERKLKAFGIAEHCGKDAAKIKATLVTEPNMGYGPKKANMFIRDMIELGVWPDLTNVDQIDVATDINTMKVALRTGVLATAMPLMSSFLDIFCHQYSYIYDMAATAWREVWRHWRKQNPSTAPASPCMLDFILYRIGREHCKEDLAEYHCASGHVFYYFGSRLRRCRICRDKDVRTDVRVVARFLPCEMGAEKLPREEGHLMLGDDKLLRVFEGICIFEDVCKPKLPGFRAFDPPMSISIKGATGWTSAYSDKEAGGGGLMS